LATLDLAAMLYLFL